MLMLSSLQSESLEEFDSSYRGCEECINMKINPVSNIVQPTVISALSQEEFMTGQGEDGHLRFIFTFLLISIVKMNVQSPLRSFI